MRSSRQRGILCALNDAAKNGSLSAAFILGRLYGEGWGVEPNPRQAFRWYLIAAEGGLSEAFYFVGAAYHFGEGVLQNNTDPYKWFQKSATAGDLTGAYMAALAVFDGVGVMRNPKRGMNMLLEAARRGSADAMDYLGAYYFSLGRRREGRQWAKRAVKAGDQVAGLRLGSFDRHTKVLPEGPGKTRRHHDDEAART